MARSHRASRGVVMAMAAFAIFAMIGGPSAAATEAPTILGAESPSAVPGEYIVGLKDTTSVRALGVSHRAQALSEKHHGKVGHVYKSALRGFSVSMSEPEAQKLAADPDVEFIEQSQRYEVSETQTNPGQWGLDRIDQRAAPLDNLYNYDSDASAVHAYIVDTGIRITHNEFSGRATWGWNFFDNNPIAHDCYLDDHGNPHGHGTHVAGIVGSNSYGVAKGVKLVAVKIFGCSGRTESATIIAGIDWVTANAIKPAVLNLSVGRECPSGCPEDEVRSIANALQRATDSGITVIAAAGNENVDACTSPYASATSVLTVGALDINDRQASYSNWGGCVNLWAPGGDQNATPSTAGILSLNNNSDTATTTLSGTSMAAPQATGAAALILARPGFVNATPAAVKNELINSSTKGVLTGLTGTSPNRLLYTSAPPVAGGSSIATARNSNGKLNVFGVNDSDSLFFATQTAANSTTFSTWLKSQQGGWYSVAADTDGRSLMEVSSLSRLESFWHRTQNSVDSNLWNGWSQLDGLLTANAVALNPAGHLEYFGVNRQGQAWRRTQTAVGGNGYSPWAAFGFGPQLRSIAAETSGSGIVQVFALTNGGELWHRWKTGLEENAIWSAWTKLDGVPLTSIAVARNSAGRLELFGANQTGAVLRRPQANGVNSWFSWSELSNAATAGKLSSVAAEVNADGRISVFGVNREGKLWQRMQTAAASDTYSEWTQIVGAPLFRR